MIVNGIFIAILIVLLTGCGEDNENKNIEPVSIELENNQIEIEENTVNLIKVVSNDFANSRIDVSTSDQRIKTYITEETLYIEVGDVDRDLDTSILIYAENNYGDDFDELAVKVNNTSSRQLIAQINSIRNSNNVITDFSEEIALFNFFNDFSYKSGAKTNSEKIRDKRLFNTLVDEAVVDIKKDSATVLEDLVKYQDGNIPDQFLALSLLDAIETANQYGFELIALINQTMLVSNLFNIAPFSGGFVYSAEVDFFSQFIGQKALGSFVNTEWVFNDDIKFMDSLLAQNQFCSIKG